MASFENDILLAAQQLAGSFRGAGERVIPLYACTLATGGTALAAFADGASATPGFAVVDSETWCIRWNNHATPTAIACNVDVPADLDPAYPVTFTFDVSKTGATAGDATTITLACYITKTGQLHDADANCGGASNAVSGALTAKTKSLLSRAIAASDVTTSLGAAPLATTEQGSFAISFGPTAGTLGTDDFCLHGAKMRYTKKYPSA